MGGKSKAPKGPKWKELISKMDELVSQNQDIFKEAMDFGKEQFSAGQEWVDKLSQYGLDQSGKLNDRATAFDKTSGKAIGQMQGIADKFGKANTAEYGTNKKLAGQLTDALMPGIQGQADLGKTLTDRYKNQAIPFEDQYLSKLRGWDTSQRREDRAGQAVGDISMSTEAARESELRRLESYGIDPSQTRSAALDSRIQAQNAVAKAAAANQARQGVEQEGLQYGANAVQIGNQSAQLGGQMSGAAAQQGGMAAAIAAQPGAQYLQGLGNLGNYQQGITQLQQAAGQTGYNMAQGAGQFGMTGLGAGAGQFNQNAQYGSGVYGQGSNMIGQSGQLTNAGYGTAGQLNANDIQRVAANNANSFGSQLGSILSSVGPAAIGAMSGNPFAALSGLSGFGGGGAPAAGTNFLQKTYAADGGAIPESASPSRGTQVDDVPAMLSANEYVIDPDTVRWFGEKHFSDLQKKAREGITGIPDNSRNKKKAA